MIFVFPGFQGFIWQSRIIKVLSLGSNIPLVLHSSFFVVRSFHGSGA